MATNLQSSGQISLGDIKEYVGGAGQMSLSGITSPYSVNQIFHSSANTITPITNTNSLSNMYSKTFGIYSSSLRGFLYGNSFSNPFDGYFRGFLGFGTTTNGTSGMIYEKNQGFQIWLTFTVDSYFVWNYLRIEGKIQGVWKTINPTAGWNQTYWNAIDYYEEITITLLDDRFSVLMGVEACPFGAAQMYAPKGTGCHIIKELRLEIFQEDSSSLLIR